MSTMLTIQKRIIIIIRTLLLIVITNQISLRVKAQESSFIEEENATCKITVNDKMYQPKLNGAGFFDRVSNVPPLATVRAEIKYSSGRAGEKVIVAAIDGGDFDGSIAKVVILNNQKKCMFDFRVGDEAGLYRVSVRKGDDRKFLRLWVTDSGKSFVAGKGEHSCGSNDDGGTDDPPDDSCDDGPPPPGDPFRPYTGNESRSVLDLQVWGSVGQVPLTWIRYGNSRHGNFKPYFGDAFGWNFSFNYNMHNNGVDGLGRKQIQVHFPEGGENTFAQDATDTSLWIPHPGQYNRVFQNGNIFIMQTARGWRYRFEKFSVNGNPYYQLQSITDQYQNTDTLIYNKQKKLIKVQEPAGRFLQVFYGKVNGLIAIDSVRTSDGRSVRYHYSVVHDTVQNNTIDWVVLDTVKYGDGTQAEYEYGIVRHGQVPQLEHATDPRYTGRYVNMRYVYDTTVHTSGFIHEERNGRTSSLMTTLIVTNGYRTVCYANGRVQVFKMPGQQLGYTNTYTDGLGRKTSYSYSDGKTGFLKTSTDALGRVTTYDSISLYGNPLQITYADGSTEKWTRDDLDLETTHTDELNRTTTYHRDAKHRIASIEYADGASESFIYNNFGEEVKHTHKNKGADSTVYDNRGLMIMFIDALGNVTHYTYDNADRLASVIDARGNTTAYVYNERGLLIKEINADPEHSYKTYGYDDFGNRTSVTDELNHTWTTVYDEFKRPISKTDPLNRTTTYEYDLPNNVCGCRHGGNNPTAIILPSGKTTRIQYDVEWQMISETIGFGTTDSATTFYEYDKVGNLTTVTDPNGHDWMTTYDKRDRKKTSKDPLANKTTWFYDGTGNVIKVMRPDDGITINQYDKMGRLLKTTDPKKQVTKMSYDDEGNMISLRDPNQHLYSFEYDLLNRKTKMIYPNDSSEKYSYDPVGNLKTYTNREDFVRTYAYDNRNREISSTWSDIVTPAVTRTYDIANRLRSVISSVNAISYGYNSTNELIADTQLISGLATMKVLNYAYNADGLLSQIIYPGGEKVSYRYTGRNQVDSVMEGNKAKPLAVYSYDPNGNRIAKALENGTNTVFAYDNANQLLTVDNKKGVVSFARFDYGYDKVNNRTYMQRDNAKGDVYTYDATDQVTGVQYDATNPNGTPTNPVRTAGYVYDSAGNRKQVTDNSVSQNYITNNLNQYTKTGDSLLTYTPTGNLKAFNGWAYTYDAQDRLIQAKKGSTTVQCTYDGLNRMIKRIINGTVRCNYYDRWNLIQDRNASDAIGAQYINGVNVDEILKKGAATDTVCYHYDALGNATHLTNKTGNVLEQYTYDVFGAPTIRNGSGNIIAQTAYGNRFMFTGREYIKEIKLYNYRNRFYSDTLGRFMQIDPIGFASRDNNLYRYVRDNPVNKIDPSGADTYEGRRNNRWDNASINYPQAQPPTPDPSSQDDGGKAPDCKEDCIKYWKERKETAIKYLRWAYTIGIWATGGFIDFFGDFGQAIDDVKKSYDQNIADCDKLCPCNKPK
ncbi:MAG TPA: RHS repeat-associated core domain-containing protein [Parafilimonas sp.]|nr:RHS repeat-associated core domain-containing protein [Parafilimonas sp.]